MLQTNHISWEVNYDDYTYYDACNIIKSSYEGKH
jgi:hypothetical protein